MIANVGDDFELHGLHVCPDIDALLYTLAGLIDAERGWGVRGDTHTRTPCSSATAGPPGSPSATPTWPRTSSAPAACATGERLTDATAALAAALGIAARILPATDDRYRTLLETDEGRLDFQDYFVRRRQEPEVRGRGLRWRGDCAADARGAGGNRRTRTWSSSVRRTRSSASVRSWSCRAFARP